MSRRNPPVTNSHHPEEGNFGVGFFLGVVSGAFGMFLFGTKQGHRLMAHIKEELSSEGEALLDQPVIQKLLPPMEETKKTVESTVGTWKNTFPKFQKKQP